MAFDPNKLQKYFHDMHHKAHTNVEMISQETIDSEDDLKQSLAKVLKHGTYSDAADMIIQAIECKVSKMILESME